MATIKYFRLCTLKDSMSRTFLASLFAASALLSLTATAADLPALAETRPAHEAIDIDEQQVFLARAKGPVDAKTFIAHEIGRAHV